MAIATSEQYAEMLDTARREGYAYPAINVTSSQTLNAALKGFADASSDGIIELSVGGAEYFSGASVRNRYIGSLAFAAFAHQVAEQFPHITIALHTDHCAKQYLAEWVEPLLAFESDQVRHGEEPLLQSHMWDGSTVSLEENLDIAENLLEQSSAAHTILEIEIGVVGGEEDGHSAKIDNKLYSTPVDGLKVAKRLGLGDRGQYMAAFTFGNFHGSYQPGMVKLHPELLGEIQSTVAAAAKDGSVQIPGGAEGNKVRGYIGLGKPFALVFHGGSGSSPEDISEAIRHGVVKMNVDTDTQYAFTRAIADHMYTHYNGVLKIDGGVGEKKDYDPRTWGASAEDSMSKRVVEACQELGSVGKALRSASYL